MMSLLSCSWNVNWNLHVFLRSAAQRSAAQRSAAQRSAAHYFLRYIVEYLECTILGIIFPTRHSDSTIKWRSHYVVHYIGSSELFWTKPWKHLEKTWMSSSWHTPPRLCRSRSASLSLHRHWLALCGWPLAENWRTTALVIMRLVHVKGGSGCNNEFQYNQED